MLTPVDDHQPAEQRLEGLTRTLRKLLSEARPLSRAAEVARERLAWLEQEGGHLTTAQRLNVVRDITNKYRADKLLDFSHHHPGDRRA